MPSMFNHTAKLTSNEENVKYIVICHKAVKNNSTICNVPSAAASKNFTSNNVKLTVGQTFKNGNLVNFLLFLQTRKN